MNEALLEQLNEQQKIYEPVMQRIERCACGKHGVIRNVEKKDEQLVLRAINYYYGCKGQWWTKTTNKTRDVEFVPMTKTFPPPRRPWEWCGKTILFQDWKDREANNEELKNKFKIGQKVSFCGKYTKGQIIIGIISGLNSRAKVIVPGQETWWNVPYENLNVT